MSPGPIVLALVLGMVASACSETSPSQSAAAPRDPSEIFAIQCALCHGPTGEGDTSVGRGYPNANLADGDFAHGGSHEEIVRTITKGVPRSPMLPLEARLSEEEIDSLARYVRALVRE